eukprot:GHVR01164229.1.p1 GENE.GHVR01164229.1~~GHVR01164229.1.p1  ORF type:complete len:175 (+),score=8.06 GHVR01164229.1:297-821(+)
MKICFSYITEDGITYLTICERSYPKKLAFTFLEEVQRSFIEELQKEFGSNSQVSYRSHIDTIEKPYYFIKFDRIIQRKKNDYKDTRSQRNRALNKLNTTLNEVQTVMSNNLDGLLLRGDNLDDISMRAADLRAHSEKFRDKAKKLNLYALLKQMAPIAVVVIILIIVLIWRFYR